MTDHIPLDLAPPPLLNGEVPLMPHMVNGDAAQQVRSKTTHARAHARKKTKQNAASVPLWCHLASFNIPEFAHTHTHTHAEAGCMQEYTSNGHAGASPFVVISTRRSAGNEQLPEAFFTQARRWSADSHHCVTRPRLTSAAPPTGPPRPQRLGSGRFGWRFKRQLISSEGDRHTLEKKQTNKKKT